MSEIWNLSALCRCCHIDGSFKSLEQPYTYQDVVEIYSNMLRETFGVSISKPPEGLSYSICDVCIYKLRETLKFKLQVVTCEEKFQEYLRNEEALNPKEIKVEIEFDGNVVIEPANCIKTEGSDHDFEDGSGGYDDCASVKSEKIKLEDIEDDIKEVSGSTSKVKRSTTRKTQKTKNTKIYSSTKVKKETKTISCRECNVDFDSRTDFIKHQQEKHAYRGSYNCTECDQNFAIGQIFKHMKKNHPKAETRVKCRFCEKYSLTRKALTDHENYVHIKDSSCVCDICNKRFAYKASLKKHILWHNGLNKKEFCELCGHGFNDRSNLRIHVDAVHFGIRKFACNDCDKRFTAKKHLRNHMASKHGGVKPYACKQCPAAFSCWKSYCQHKKMHEGNETNETNETPVITGRIYHCKGCPEKFENRGLFKSHVLKHNKEGSSPHICHICGRGFTCQYSLNRHVDNHSGIKRFSCDICHQKFTQKSQVHRHKRNLHDPVKKEKTEKVKCPICKINVRDIVKHQNRHVIRPFACEMCDRTYPFKNALNRHRKEFHLGIFKHGCTVCNTKYKTATLLAKHRMKKHKDDVLVDYSGLPYPEIPVLQT